MIMHSTELYSNTRHLPFRDLLHLREMSKSSKSPRTKNKAFSDKVGGTNTEDTGPSSHDIAGVSPRVNCILQFSTVSAVTLRPESPPGAIISRWGYDLIEFCRGGLNGTIHQHDLISCAYPGMWNQESMAFKVWMLCLVLISGICSMGFGRGSRSSI